MALITRQYSDIDLDFTKHPVTGDITKKKDVSAISTSLYNLFATSNYERLFNPNLGCALKQLLFEPMDNVSVDYMQDIIKQTILNFEPRVRLEYLEVKPDYSNNGYTVYVTFFYANSADPITIRFFLERVR